MNSKSLRLLERKLLVISCTATKKNYHNAPALEVYDGPTFRTLRKHIPPNVDVLIISAKYGIIGSEDKISPYNLRMTNERASELKTQVSDKIDKFLSSGIYSEVFFELGKDYSNTVSINTSGYSMAKFTFDRGTIGIRLHNLKKWLENC